MKKIFVLLLGILGGSLLFAAATSVSENDGNGVCQCTQCQSDGSVCGAAISAEASQIGSGDECWRCAHGWCCQ